MEDWKVKVRNWWYSLQDEAAVAEWGVPEKYRVEIETIIKHQLQKAREEALREIIEVRNDRNKSTRELLDTIDKYQAELDQDVSK